MSSTQCPARDQLQRFLSGELSVAQCDEVAGHIETCVSCLDFLRAMDGLDGGLRERRQSPHNKDADQRRLPNSSIADTIKHQRPVENAPFVQQTDSLIDASSLDNAKYEFLGELGRGGMGVVLKARQRSTGRLVALKMIVSGELAGPEEQQRFLIEVELAAKLKHPNIVQVYEAGELNGRPYFSMEFINGETLANRLRAGPLSPLTAARLIERLARAVHFAHEQQIIHRDLKPANVLLDKVTGLDGLSLDASAERVEPKINDFGLAKRLDAPGLTQSNAIMGTPRYMAPEQARGDSKSLGPPVDVYSLGVLLYELLTGRPPHLAATNLETIQQLLHQEPVSPRQLQPQIPRDLETVCLKCLQKEPGRRYRTAAELADRMRMILDGHPIPDRPISTLERGWRWCRRNRAVAGLTGAVAVALLIGMGAAWGLAGWALREARTLEVELKTSKRLRRLAGEAALEHGISEAQRGDPARGLLWFARAVDVTPGEDDDLQWSARMQIAAWSREAHSLRLFVTSSERVISATLSSDGARLLVATRDADGKTDRLRAWDTISGKPTALQISAERTFRGDGPSVTVSTDGALALTIVNDTAQLWQTSTGQPIGEPIRQAGSIRSAHFSPDGRFFLLHAETIRQVVNDGAKWEIHRGQVARYDTATAKEASKVLLPIGNADDSIGIEAISPDGKRILVMLSDYKSYTRKEYREVRLWDTVAGKEIGPPLPISRLGSGLFSPNGDVLLLWDSRDEGPKLWDATNGEVLVGPLEGQTKVDRWAKVDRQAEMDHQAEVDRRAELAQFSPDSAVLAKAQGVGGIRLWCARCGHSLHAFGQGRKFASLRFSADRKLLATSTTDGIVLLWDTAEGRQIGAPLRHPEAASVDFSRDGKQLITTLFHKQGGHAEVRLWDLKVDFHLDRRVTQEGLIPRCVAWSSDSSILYTGRYTDRGTELRSWSARSGESVGKLVQLERVVSSFKPSPDGKTFLTLHRVPRLDDQFRLWNTSGAQLSEPIPEGIMNDDVRFSPDGKLVLVTMRDHTEIRFRDAMTGRPAGKNLDLPGLYYNLQFNGDGSKLLVGWDGKESRNIQLWDVINGEPLGPPINLPAFSGRLLALAANGRIAASQGKEDVQLWDAVSGNPHCPPLGTGLVDSLCFSPDSSSLLTVGAFNQRAELWSVDTRKPLAEPLRHEGHVDFVSFTPNGKLALTNDSQIITFSGKEGDETSIARGAARLWDARTGKAVGPAQRGHPTASAVLSPDGTCAAIHDNPNSVRLWRIPVPVAGDAYRLNLWAQLSTGLELDENGTVRELDGQTWNERRERLKLLGGEP